MQSERQSTLALLSSRVASALATMHSSQHKRAKIEGLLLNKPTLDALTAGQGPRRIAEGWRDQIEEFTRVRAKYLIY